MSTTRSTRTMNIAVVAVVHVCRQASRACATIADCSTPRPPLADGASLFPSDRR
ncbi:hypothetical protein [Halomonas sp. THAF5a]|uniref:hypothetical protein n=1 Tax=Halomonas sp. THAF5a TaxID=2587844 RepID=UPI0015628624|nr:hypothetical protein [Halomonas sp. THAF5a]